MLTKGLYEYKGLEILTNNQKAGAIDYQAKYTSFVSKSQLSFLIGLLANYKFSDNRPIQTTMEIGIYNGVTSLYMLQEGCKHSKDYLQYGIEIGKSYFYGQAANEEASSEEKKTFFLTLGVYLS